MINPLKLNADDLFEDMTATALLREIGNDRYSFTHLTIQEYLAATIVVKDKNLSKLFCKRILILQYVRWKYCL